jgi:hypothetical protein
VLVVSHDEEFITAAADSIADVAGGRVELYKSAPYSKLGLGSGIPNPAHTYPYPYPAPGPSPSPSLSRSALSASSGR